MSPVVSDGVGTILGGVALWVAGLIFFDAVHVVLHAMLRSRSALLRSLAWPHAVHHRWLDRELEIHRDLQSANVWCHLVPEYLTQLAFAAVASLFVAPRAAALCAVLQTAVFIGLLTYRGLDINHRPIEMLDAYRPSWLPLPAYHALHHVYPDAYFASYAKVVDWIAGGGAMLGGLRYAMQGSETEIGRALREQIEHHGAAEVTAVASAAAVGAAVDVLVLCEVESSSEAEWVESYIAATRRRRLPPRVWVVQAPPASGIARHYHGDRRVSYRAILLPDAVRDDLESCRHAARAILFWARRGFHVIPATPAAWRAARNFRRLQPEPPPGLGRIRSRVATAT